MTPGKRTHFVRTNASFGEAITVALGSLASSKLRSFLTLLGIILATTTLIAVMSVIHGMDVYIAQNVSDMGADGFLTKPYEMRDLVSIIRTRLERTGGKAAA